MDYDSRRPARQDRGRPEVGGKNRKWEPQTRTESRRPSREPQTGSYSPKPEVGATGGAECHGPEAVSKTAALNRNFRSYVRPSTAGRKWTTAPSGPRGTERERSGGAEVEGKKRNRQP